MKKAVITGSFDPITKGHEYLIRQAVEIFDEVFVAIGVNGEKKTMFSLEQRKKWISDTFDGCDKIKVLSYNGLTADFCKKNDIKFIVRGLRNTVDFDVGRAGGLSSPKQEISSLRRRRCSRGFSKWCEV